MARSALPKAVCDDVRNSAQAAYEATSRSRDAPGRVAQLTNVAMMPARRDGMASEGRPWGRRLSTWLGRH
eukprot:363399-Chlamydomonas_euryale.AAC.2